MKRKKLSATIVAVLLCVGVLAWCCQEVRKFSDTPLTIEHETIFTLPVGTGWVALETLLRKDNLMSDTRLLPWLLRIEPELSKFKAGTYRLIPGMTLRGMLNLLVSGKEVQFSIRFIEGTVLRDWLSVLHHAKYIQHQLVDKSDEEISRLLGLQNNIYPEGWFYPDTYMYTAGTSDLLLLKRSYQRMEKVVEEVWQRRERDLPYKTPAELLTMASIVEKETAINDERAKIASVFVNRLHIGMKLQTDPTVIYGMGSRYAGILTRKDLAATTDYNTYVISGLPPTPIAMPSYASLFAAAHPAVTPYLYFVADGKGGHSFNTDLASHNKAVDVYRRGLKDNYEK